MQGRWLSKALRLGLLLALALLVALGVWHGASTLARSSQALAPVVGQYYQGQPWMTDSTPTPVPTATPTLWPTATPIPSLAAPASTSVPQAAGAVDQAAQRPTETPLPPATPEPFLVEVALAHGIDPAGTYVVVNQNAQRMSIVQDGLLLRVLPISTGDPDLGWYTPAWSGQIGKYWGTFSANGAWADDAWYLFQAGGSILIHSLPYTLDDQGNRQYQGRDQLGLFPASRGCIRLAPEEARWFSDWDPQGVPIVILPWDGGSGRQG